MKRNLIAALLVTLALQTAPLELRLSRDWGYGGLEGGIQGRFSLHASGPGDLAEVRFLFDGAVVNVDREAPFRFQFETDDYPPGTHTLGATGVLSNGETVDSPEFVRNFLSPEEAQAEMQRIIFPILAVVGVLVVVGGIVPLLFMRRREHKPGVYGMAGGAVCKRCGMPFSRSILAPNLLLGKLARCPHCGKWGIVPRASAAELEAAEARLAVEGKMEGAPAETEEEKRRRLLEESRFDN
ncbi:MAG TPA: Ig-like domain-containing protein [Anaerolineales bacterium]|nr:Ig-like domain-containing protein [Anaerolineales bacterium]